MTAIGQVRLRGFQNISESSPKARMLIGAVTLIVCFFCMSGSSAEANAPVQAFSITPSTTQAGGHPNITTEYELGTRDNEHILRILQRCNCQDAKARQC